MTIALAPARANNGRSYVHHTAMQAVAAGVSVVPIRTDGSKQPALSGWRTYQKRRASAQEIDRWFRPGKSGIAFITGAVSGNLEALDFDNAHIFEAWLNRLQQVPALSALYNHLSWGYLEATPAGGRHLLYRCDVIEGNQKLAKRPGDDSIKTLIETRGEGGLIIVAPSRGGVHPSGKSYVLLSGGVSSIRTITAHQRRLLFALARKFDEMPPPESSSFAARKSAQFEGGADDLRPGDLFNQQASWEEVLGPHGWQFVRISNGEGYWRRPDKNGPGISATTNYSGSDLLYVFSTSTIFDSEKGYTKFSAYALLNHHGDFSAAARELAQRGYTSKEVQ
ncbi:MAG TPA: bifunctional DNA primase/polymerase [Ktedonobacteraceae bacterium]|jgi:putative DNA primase/helicase